MRYRDLTHAALALAAAAALAVGMGAPAGAAPAAATVTGTIQSVAPGLIVVTTPAGQTKVETTGTTRMIGRQPARLSDIKTGDFIGVDAKKGAEGILTAVAINIFPAALKGHIREGQWLMESGDTMTNAVVTQYVTQVSSRAVTLKYEDGTATIMVPPSTSIHRLTALTAAALKPGLHATVRGTENADGSVTATSIVVDEMAQ